MQRSSAQSDSAITIHPPSCDREFDAWLQLRNELTPGPRSTRETVAFSERINPNRQRWIGCLDGQPVGFAACAEWKEPGPRACMLSLGVQPHARLNGVGRALAAQAVGWAREQGLTTAYDCIRDTEHLLLGFWQRRGLEILERHPAVELDLTTAPVLPQRPLQNGVSIVTLAERPDLERAVYDAALEAWSDEPTDVGGEQTFTTYEEFRAGLRDFPGEQPELLWIALRADAEVLGYLQLWQEVTGDPRIAWHSYTGVVRRARGLGIATALKQRAIEQAPRYGIQRLRTTNHERNEPMRHINHTLGYRLAYTSLVLRGPVWS